MSHKESFIGVSVVTTLPLFSSIAERSNLGVHTPLHLSDAYGSAVESRYKLPLYKLWQYLPKNKTYTNNEKGRYFFHKKRSCIRLNAALYQSSSKRVVQVEDDTTQSASINQKEWSSLGASLFFYKRNGRSIDWRNVFGVILHIHTISRMLVHVQNVLRKYKIYSRKKQDLRWNNLTSPSDKNTVWQHSKRSHKISVCINEIFYHRVYCS